MKSVLLFFLFAANLAFAGQDTLTVMYYNILNYDVVKLPYYKTIIGYTKADIIVLNEVASDEASIAILNAINEIGICNYSKVDFTDGVDKDNMLLYNADKLALKMQDTIATELRLINRYLLYHINTNGDTAFMDFYSAHLKSSTGSGNAMQRYRETKEFKNYVENQTEARNVFFGGDMNFYNYTTEPACQLLLDSGAVRFYDPIDKMGNWHDNPDYAITHTQSTRKRQFGGGASGGLDDRFDFIFTTSDILNGNNRVRYIDGTYIALGNDGLRLNDSLTALPLSETVPDSITYALYYSSDHLAVIMKVIVQIKNMIGIPEAKKELGNLIDIEVYNTSGTLLFKGLRINAPAFVNEFILIRYNYQNGVITEKSIGLKNPI
ncbi:MAG: hypothetical protein PF489_04530 [Salinivirgaceae bacterium]|jgi:hypothetical protein|nr:hypothetical protein [Salinivirgaceae bacterium]